MTRTELDWPLAVGVSKRDRMIIAARPFMAGELVHVAPVVVVPNEQVAGVLENYVYTWRRGRSAIALGFGSLFNHSKTPTLCLQKYPTKRLIMYWAIRSIDAETELTIDYGYEPNGYDGR
jgi:hypothetical protein